MLKNKPLIFALICGILLLGCTFNKQVKESPQLTAKCITVNPMLTFVADDVVEHTVVGANVLRLVGSDHHVVYYPISPDGACLITVTENNNN